MFDKESVQWMSKSVEPECKVCNLIQTATYYIQPSPKNICTPQINESEFWQSPLIKWLNKVCSGV